MVVDLIHFTEPLRDTHICTQNPNGISPEQDFAYRTPRTSVFCTLTNPVSFKMWIPLMGDNLQFEKHRS